MDLTVLIAVFMYHKWYVVENAIPILVGFLSVVCSMSEQCIMESSELVTVLIVIVLILATHGQGNENVSRWQPRC